MGSPPHKAILLDATSEHIGVGYIYAPSSQLGYQHYWTTDVASSEGDRVAPPSTCDPVFFQILLPIIKK
jgi:hypothetical protein